MFMADLDRARRMLTDNVRRIIGERSINAVAVQNGIPQRTLWNLANAVEEGFDPRLSTIDAVAQKLGLEAYELLKPGTEDDSLILRFLNVLKNGSTEARTLLELALQMHLPVPERKRKRSAAARARSR
jgi:hypothetical protein